MSKEIYDVNQDIQAEQIQNAPRRAESGRSLREKIRLGIRIGAATLAATIIYGLCSGEAVDEEYSAETQELAVTKIEPIALDCRARTTAEFKNQAKLNLKVFGLDVASDYKANTSGVVETLTCLKASGTNVQGPDEEGNQFITIPVSSVRLFSRINEEKTRPDMDFDATADVGRGALSMLDKFGLASVNKELRKKDGDLQQAGRIHAVIEVEEKCSTAAWDITKEVIKEGYKLAAFEQGINPNTIHVSFDSEGVTPDFQSEYELPEEYTYSTNSIDTCKVAENARVPAIAFKETNRGAR